MLKYIIIVLIIGILYERYREVESKELLEGDYSLVKRYLLNEKSEMNGPLLWVHLDNSINSRVWLNYGSRNSKSLNQPYKYITLQSIINKSKGKFNVCMVDDESFSKLIPGWYIDINRVSDPMKSHFRTLGMAKLLYYYGGLTLPSSYLALEDIETLYNRGLQGATAFTFETLNRTMTSSIDNKINEYTPNHRMMGCVKHSPVMKELVLYLERLNSKDFTSEQDFVGHVSRWLYSRTIHHNPTKKINLIDAKLIGVKDNNDKPISLEQLLQSSYIDFTHDIQGIYIPDDELLRRTKFSWFAHLSPKDIYDSNTILAKYMLLSNN